MRRPLCCFSEVFRLQRQAEGEQSLAVEKICMGMGYEWWTLPDGVRQENSMHMLFEDQ